MQKAREVIHGGKFLSISVDEVTTVDNQAWISIHAYVVQDFYRTPILVSVERLTEGATAPKLAEVIVDALFVHGGLTPQHLLSKLVSFGADGASVFQVIIVCLFSLHFFLIV
jgi:hypothetical protein